MKSFKHGLVFGKFYPPTNGHIKLIETASSQCENLTILLYVDDRERISGDMRKRWLRTLFPYAFVHKQNMYGWPTDFTKSATWARYIDANIHAASESGFGPLDAVFTAEDYGDETVRRISGAAFWDVTHVPVERGSDSATRVRNDPYRFWDSIPAVVRPFFVKRFAIVGPESCGKTTLTRKMAEEYRTQWAPEFARMYGEEHQLEQGRWKEDINLFDMILKGQPALEESLAKIANRLLFCDTDLMCTSIWHELFHDRVNPQIYEASKETDLYEYTFVCSPDVPWEDDSTREYPHKRQWFFDRIIEEVERRGRKYVVLPAHAQSRKEIVCDIVDRFIP